MSELLLGGGGPLAVPRDGDRIGLGPWARLLVIGDMTMRLGTFNDLTRNGENSDAEGLMEAPV